jgi:hypothetical protein
MAIIDEIRENQEEDRQAKLNVKPGDKWFKLARFDKALEVEVTKVTKTQITFSDGERMSRASDKIIGHGTYYHVWYRPATAHLRAEIEQEANEKKIASDLQAAITRAHAGYRELPLDKKVELTNLINRFFESM